MTRDRYRTTSPSATHRKGAQCVTHGLGFGFGGTAGFTTSAVGSAGTAGRNGASSGDRELKGSNRE